MKRLLFIGALSGANARAAHSQTIAAMTEQLVELNAFNRATVSGYHLLSSGLDSVDTVNEREYLLHVNYFQSLDVLNPNLGVDPGRIKKLNTLIFNIKELLYDETLSPARSARSAGRIALPR